MSKEDKLPEDIKRFIDDVCDTFMIEEALGDVGYSYSPMDDDPRDGWIIEIYPTPMEILHGKDDGAEATPNFTVDLMAIMALFDKETKEEEEEFCRFDNHGGQVPRVSFAGTVGGVSILLDVLSSAPEGVKPGFTLDTKTGAVGEKDDPEKPDEDP